jgi:hypothetical protein
MLSGDRNAYQQEVRMKKTLQLTAVCLSGLLLAGCLVRSVEPWLPDSTRIATPSLAGTWLDGDQMFTAVFTLAEGSNYQVRTIGGDKTDAFTASLHKVDDFLLLVVGPDKPEGLNASTCIPAHLLFKVEWAENAMKLYPLDLNSIDARLRGSPLSTLSTGSKEKGFVLLSPTPDLAAFVRSQLPSADFFTLKPLYQFKRAPVPVPNAAK